MAHDNSTIAGTAVTEARAATTVYRGGVGTTTLNIEIQTATQDNPTHESGLSGQWLQKFRGGNAVAARDLENQRDGHHRARLEASAPEQGRDR